MVREDLKLEVRTAMQQAKKQSAPVKKEGLQIWDNDLERLVTINIIPFKTRKLQESYFLILFEDTPTAPKLVEVSSKTLGRKATTEKEVARLQQELTATKEHLLSLIHIFRGLRLDCAVSSKRRNHPSHRYSKIEHYTHSQRPLGNGGY